MQNEEFDFDREKLSQKLLNEYLEDEDALSDDERERRKWLRVRRALLGLVSALLLGFFIFAWQTDKFAFTSSGVESLPLVRADKTPVKVKPDDPGGIKVANMDKSIYNSIEGQKEEKKLPKVTRILPAPEAPVRRAEIALRPLGTEEIDKGKDTKKALSSPQTPSTDAPKQLEEKPAQKPKEPTIEDVIGDALKDVTPSDIMPSPVPRRKKIEVPSNKVVDNGPRIQLGAFRTHVEAKDHWKKVHKKFSKQLEGKRHYIVKVDLGAKGIFYRLQVGMLENASEGRAVCNELIEQKQGCFIVKQ